MKYWVCVLAQTGHREGQEFPPHAILPINKMEFEYSDLRPYKQHTAAM